MVAFYRLDNAWRKDDFDLGVDPSEECGIFKPTCTFDTFV